MAKADVRITLAPQDFQMILEILDGELEESKSLIEEARLSKNADDIEEASSRYYILERLIRELKG